jgi:hypothetical protein
MLLRKFRSNCRSADPPIAAALVNLEDRSGDSVVSLLNQIVEQLSDAGLDFSKFHKSMIDSTLKDDLELKTQDKQNVYIEVSGDYYRQNNQFDQKLLIEVFMEDLALAAGKVPVILLFDSYERASNEIRDWLLETLISQLIIKKSQSNRLLLVLAGREGPDLQAIRPRSETDWLVQEISLGKWGKDQIRRLLELNGLKIEDDEFNQIFKLSDGSPLAFTMLVDQLKRQQRQPVDKKRN